MLGVSASLWEWFSPFLSTELTHSTFPPFPLPQGEIFHLSFFSHSSPSTNLLRSREKKHISLPQHLASFTTLHLLPWPTSHPSLALGKESSSSAPPPPHLRNAIIYCCGPMIDVKESKVAAHISFTPPIQTASFKRHRSYGGCAQISGSMCQQRTLCQHEPLYGQPR